MGERNANIGPRYAVRLLDLRPYHILTASCSHCRHKQTKRLWEITAGMPPHTFLSDMEQRLRCRRCGSRGDARLLVTVSEED